MGGGFHLATVDNNDTVSKGFIWFHSKNETIKREVKLSFRTETMLISLSNWDLSNCQTEIYFFILLMYRINA